MNLAELLAVRDALRIAHAALVNSHDISDEQSDAIYDALMQVEHLATRLLQQKLVEVA